PVAPGRASLRRPRPPRGLRVRRSTRRDGPMGRARGSLLLAVLGNEELRRAAVGAAAAGALLRRGRRHGLPPPPGRAMALLFSWPATGERCREAERRRRRESPPLMRSGVDLSARFWETERTR